MQNTINLDTREAMSEDHDNDDRSGGNIEGNSDLEDNLSIMANNSNSDVPSGDNTKGFAENDKEIQVNDEARRPNAADLLPGRDRQESF